MTYRTKVKTIEAYHFLGNPEEDPKIPYWLKNRIESREIVYSNDGSGILWIYPHRNVIALQQAHIGDYVTYDSQKDEVWVEWKYEFESRYEPA